MTKPKTPRKAPKPDPVEPSQEAVEAAYAIIGRLNGRKGGEARNKALSPKRRKEIAMMGVQARLAKKAEKDGSKNNP
jgi:hypothetical protein